MPRSRLATAIESVVTNSARALGELRINVDKILWGNPSPSRDKKSSAKYGNKPPREPKSYTPQTVQNPSVRENANAIAAAQAAGPALPPNFRPSPVVQSYQFQSVLGPDDTPPDNILDTIVATRNQPEKQLQYQEVKTKAEKPKLGQRLSATGLFNALDALNSVNLCNVVSYAYDNINIKRQPRPERSTWNASQVAFYFLQDQAGIAKNSIDKYRSYPNTFIGSYFGVGPNAQPPQQAVSQSGAPIQGGIAVQKYNIYFLLQNLGEVFSTNTNTTGSLFSSEDVQLLRAVPGLGSNLNFINDFQGEINKYSDYRQITNAEFFALEAKINKLWSICNTVQNLNFRNATTLAGNFIGVDVRKEVQKLSEFIDITRIIPELKKINDNIRSFIKIATQVQKVITTGQFIIKTAILIYKVFKFIFLFFKTLVVPLIFGSVGTQVTIQDVADRAKEETDGIVRVLKSLNRLLGVATDFVRYLVVNANELLRRLDTLYLNLQACDAFKDSDLLNELQQTRKSLSTLLDSLAIYIIDYDSKTDPDTALFGTYEIRIIDEEVVDLSITNRRRRGVALDRNGTIVTQSDLTFATNPQVIIGEVKQKLVSLGLVRPELAALDSDTLAVISESLTYLDNNDITADDLNISSVGVDLPNNIDETQGVGLNAFINNLPGGRRLRQRTRTSVTQSRQKLTSQLARERVQAAQSIGAPTPTTAGVRPR